MREWYAVQARPHKEFVTRDALARIDGLDAYLPTWRVEPINPRARKIHPFFPGYLFVCCDLDQVGLSRLKWTPGVARIIGCDHQPTAIDPSIIEQIRCQVDRVQQDGVYGLGQFRRGDRVRVVRGPFAGFEGMFDVRLGDKMRVRILIEFLGRLTTAKVDVRDLEKVSRRVN